MLAALYSYCLVDADPYGCDIYSVYKFGPSGQSVVQEDLSVPSMQLIGLQLDHLESLGVLQECALQLEARDMVYVRKSSCWTTTVLDIPSRWLMLRVAIAGQASAQ